MSTANSALTDECGKKLSPKPEQANLRLEIATLHDELFITTGLAPTGNLGGA